MTAWAPVRRALVPLVQNARDLINDIAIAPKLRRLRSGERYRAQPSRRVLIVGVQSAKRVNSLQTIFAQMASGSRHDVVTASCPVGSSSKLGNTNMLLSRHDLATFDWVVMTDDDVTVAPHFLDDIVHICEALDLRIAMPAHRAFSYRGYPITVRRRGVLARQTNFVEIGPTVLFHRSVFDDVFPLPELKIGWGAELPWTVLAEQQGFRIGIVDAQALRHWGRIARSYPYAAAMAELEAFKQERGIVWSFDSARTVRTFTSLP